MDVVGHYVKGLKQMKTCWLIVCTFMALSSFLMYTQLKYDSPLIWILKKRPDTKFTYKAVFMNNDGVVEAFCEDIARKYFRGDRKGLNVLYQVSDMEHRENLCSVQQYPSCFILDKYSQDFVDDVIFLEACVTQQLIIHAVTDRGQHVDCEPWVDWYARLVGPRAQMRNIGKYNVYFNAVNITYIGEGRFAVTLPPLDTGQYRLEISIAHKENQREEIFSTIIGKFECLDEPITNTPILLDFLDMGKCGVLPEPTPLCRDGDKPGRWVTVPKTGCDGAICEGDINILASNRRVWAPYNCHYKVFNSSDLKQCISGKRVLLLGDSLTEEIANEVMQIYHHKPDFGLPVKAQFVLNRTWLGRLVGMQWTKPLQGEGRIGFSKVFGRPLGKGLEGITAQTVGNLTQKYNTKGKIDLLIVLTGAHDNSPRRRPRVKYIEKYEELLPLFHDKIRHLLADNGEIVWINIPESSDMARCDFNANPRLSLMNGLTQKYLRYKTNDKLKFINYFRVSEGCQCGDLHKGIRFFTRDVPASKRYNGFLSRMIVHMILTLFC